MGDSNAGESLFITRPVPLTPSLRLRSHLTLNNRQRPALGPSLSCSSFPAASLTQLLPSGPSHAGPGTAATFPPQGLCTAVLSTRVCSSKYPPDPACSSSCSRTSSPQRGLPAPTSLLCVAGWMLNSLLALGVEAHTWIPNTPGLAGGSGSRGTITEQGGPSRGPCPPELLLGLSGPDPELRGRV